MSKVKYARKYIRKSYLLDIVDEIPVVADGEENKVYVNDVIQAIYNSKDADVEEVKYGHWKKVRDKAPRYACNQCNRLYNNKSYKRCPFCGAYMKDCEKKV